MNTKSIVDNLIEGIKFYVNEKLKSAPYDRTDTAIVVGVSEFGYNVKYNGKVYLNVNTIGGICSINESVKILIPQNNLNNMFIVKGSTNHDIIDIQNEINQLELDKLDKVGDSSNTTVAFTESGTRINILSEETLSTLFGKIKKYFTDLKAIAFSGLASDLTQDSTHRLITDTEKTDWNSKAPQNHASIEATYGIGTSVNYGHVKLSDNYNVSSGNADSGNGASSKGLYDLYEYVNINLGKLLNNITLYVATTGSDVTGDGTSGNPFKTIQHAIDSLPKDLGGYEVKIVVQDGTYPEDVGIEGFYNGTFRLYSNHPTSISTLCKINKILVSQCMAYVYVTGFDLQTTTDTGIASYNNKAIMVNYINLTTIASTQTGMYFADSNFQVYDCVVSNHMNALHAFRSFGVSGYWGTTSGNTNSLNVSNGSVVKNLGTQPQGNHMTDTGGTVFFDNGTQLSGPFGGLSCTWGAISGGYVRNGNLKGVAMVTVNIGVALTTQLSALTEYTISGFPVPYAQQFVAITCNISTDFYSHQIDGNGVMRVTVLNNALPSGLVYYFSASYLTNL